MWRGVREQPILSLPPRTLSIDLRSFDIFLSTNPIRSYSTLRKQKAEQA